MNCSICDKQLRYGTYNVYDIQYNGWYVEEDGVNRPLHISKTCTSNDNKHLPAGLEIDLGLLENEQNKEKVN